jgi:hypothetical protein
MGQDNRGYLIVDWSLLLSQKTTVSRFACEPVNSQAGGGITGSRASRLT